MQLGQIAASIERHGGDAPTMFGWPVYVMVGVVAALTFTFVRAEFPRS